MNTQSMYDWSVILGVAGAVLFSASYFLLLLSQHDGKGMRYAAVAGIVTGNILFVPAAILYAGATQAPLFLLLLLIPAYFLTAVTVIYVKIGRTGSRKAN